MTAVKPLELGTIRNISVSLKEDTVLRGQAKVVGFTLESPPPDAHSPGSKLGGVSVHWEFVKLPRINVV